MHRNFEVPLLNGPSGAETVVALLSEHPVSYAPAVAAELALLRTCGVDIRALPISNTAIPSSRQRAAGSATHRLRVLTAVARELIELLLRNARVARRDGRAYYRGLGTLLRCVGTPRQSVRARSHWLLHFMRAVAIGDRLTDRGIRRCHAHFTTNIAMFIADVFPIEVSMTLHGPSDFNRVPARITRNKISVASFVRVVSHDGLQRALEVSAPADHQKLILIPLGVDLQRFGGGVNHETSQRVRIVCVARLEPVKGHSVLLEAFSSVARSGRPVELLLLGNGTRRKLIERKIRRLGLQSFVSCLGSVDHDSLPTLLGSAHVFALASFAEGLPVALMEAMAIGLACVATRVNGIPELVHHAETGLLVPQGDSAALARALTDLVDKPSLRQSLGDRARRRIASHYSASTNANRFASILEGVSAPSGNWIGRRHIEPKSAQTLRAM